MSRFARRWPLFVAVAFSAVTASCTSAGTMGTSAAAQSKPGAWLSLLSANSADAWRGYKMTTLPPGWSVADGVLSKTKTTEDIITKDEFSNFEFETEWKLEKGGNSGVFYRASEEFERVYWSAIEYQLLDDANAPDGRNPLTSAGSAYGLYAPPRGIVKPAGEWNSTRIVVNGAHVEHWLNGVKVVDMELWSPDWEAKVAASKFKTWAKYGRAKTGHIAIQGDHNGALSLRHMRIRSL